MYQIPPTGRLKFNFCFKSENVSQTLRGRLQAFLKLHGTCSLIFLIYCITEATLEIQFPIFTPEI